MHTWYTRLRSALGRHGKGVRTADIAAVGASVVSTPSRAHEHAGVVEVEGAHLRYRIEGHGPPCLVVGSSVYYPRVFSQELRARLQLIFLDLRHFAVTDPAFTPDHITLDIYADDIEQARQTLNLGEVIVMGHSIHGILALEYARRYPEQLRGVVAIGSPAHLSDDTALARDRLWQAEASEERKASLGRLQAQLTPELLAALSPAARFVRAEGASGPQLWYDFTYDDSRLWEGVELNFPVLERLGGELLDTYDLAQGPGEITSPVLIAQGKYDFRFPYTLWEEHRHKLPRHTYVLFERSGHTPQFEEPDRFDETLLTWANGIESSRS